MRPTRDTTRAALLALALLAAGCGTTKPSRFYVLAPVEAEAEAEERAPKEDPVRLRVAEVKLATYLSGTTLVTRVDAHRLEHSEYDRWAEPLEDGFRRVLGMNLLALTDGVAITLFPWDRTYAGDLVLHVAVSRFDVEAGEARLDALWRLTEDGANPNAGMRHDLYTAPLADGDDPEQVVAALSACLAEFSADVAAELVAHAGGS
jgi:uncharacterized lipoprotein YmbA